MHDGYLVSICVYVCERAFAIYTKKKIYTCNFEASYPGNVAMGNGNEFRILINQKRSA